MLLNLRFHGPDASLFAGRAGAGQLRGPIRLCVVLILADAVGTNSGKRAILQIFFVCHARIGLTRHDTVFRETVAPTNYRLVNSAYHDYRQRFGKGRPVPRFFHSAAWRIRATEREAATAPDQS